MDAKTVDSGHEALLARARDLARAGRLDEADDLLSKVFESGSPGFTALDLRARVHAQRGRLAEADACWAEAERLAPGDPEVAAARRRVAALRDRPRRPLRVPPLAGRAVVGVLAFAMLADLWWGHRSGPSEEPTPPSPPPTAEAGPQSAALDLALPGVHVARLGEEIEVTFDRPLFRRGAVLVPRGRAVLEDLAARLRPHRRELVISIVGRTDDLPLRSESAFSSNLELGTARASAVREVLRSAAGMPMTRLAVSSLGGIGDAASGGRTVILRIGLAEAS